MIDRKPVWYGAGIGEWETKVVLQRPANNPDGTLSECMAPVGAHQDERHVAYVTVEEAERRLRDKANVIQRFQLKVRELEG